MKPGIHELDIATSKSHSLGATKYTPASENGFTIIISSATGVLQGYYKKFSLYFSSLGYIVYTFDYHGIGMSGSDIPSLKSNTGNLKSWGSVDQAAVMAYAKSQHPHNKLVLVTHSVGGQVLGFNPNYPLADKIILVASQSGYWKYFKGWHLPKMFLFWYVMIPVLTPLFGYFPAKKIGLFENLPKQMVYQWAKWGRKKNYMMEFYDSTTFFFDKVGVPLLSLSFPKDPFAPKEAVDWLTKQYSEAKKERIHYIPDRNKMSRLRHFGFFREEFKDELWTLTHSWIMKV